MSSSLTSLQANSQSLERQRHVRTTTERLYNSLTMKRFVFLLLLVAIESLIWLLHVLYICGNVLLFILYYGGMKDPKFKALKSLNIFRKDPKQKNIQRLWINYDDYKDDFWAAIRSNYDYIMDTNLIETCKVKHSSIVYIDITSNDWKDIDRQMDP